MRLSGFAVFLISRGCSFPFSSKMTSISFRRDRGKNTDRKKRLHAERRYTSIQNAFALSQKRKRGCKFYTRIYTRSFFCFEYPEFFERTICINCIFYRKFKHKIYKLFKIYKYFMLLFISDAFGPWFARGRSPTLCRGVPSGVSANPRRTHQRKYRIFMKFGTFCVV